MRKRKAGEKGGGAGKKEKGSFLQVFFSCLRFLKFYGPDCLGAWNRLVQQSLSLPEEGRDECKGVLVLHDAAPAFSISCPVYCTAKLAEREGSEALGVRVKKGRIFGTVYFCQSNKGGKLLISRFSIHSRGKLDLEFWYQS